MTDEQSMVGRTISGKYRILSLIGSGAMGSVYLAEHTAIQKKIALKILHSDLNVNDDILRRFQQEGIAAGKFSHVNAIQIFDFDKDGDNTYYLAMEYVEGKSLKELLESDGAQPASKAIHITQQILGALAEAHRQGIIHRDLKPENLMITDPDSDFPGVKILDFGISKLMDFSGGQELRTQTGRIMGTPYYMAPEQFSGETVDHRSDIFATGLVLFELLAGKRPFQGETVSEILFKHAVEATPSIQSLNPDQVLPQGLNEIVSKAAQKKPIDRYQSAGEMNTDLGKVDLGRIETKAKPRGSRLATGLSSDQPQSSSGLKTVIGILVMVILAGSAFFLYENFFGSDSDGAVRVSLKNSRSLSDSEKKYLQLLDEARTKMAMGKTVEALNAANLALRLDCKDSEGYLVRGLAYLQKTDFDTARPDFQEALRLDPDYAEAVTGIGSVHLEKGELDSALARFEQAAELKPDLGAAIAGKGITHYKKGELEIAEENLRTAIDRDPTHARAHLFLGKINLNRDDIDQAGHHFIEAKRNDPTLWDAYYSMGRVYERQGDTDGAEQQYREATKASGTAVHAELALAFLLLDKDRVQDAKKLSMDILVRYPEIPKSHLLDAMVFIRVGDMDRSTQSLETAIRLGIEDARAHSLLGLLYQDAAQHRSALDQYRCSVDLDPDQPISYQNIGICLIRLERYEEARDALEKSIMIDASRAYPHFAIGLLYMDFLPGEESDAFALAAFTEYRKLGGQDPKVPDWISDLEP